VDADVISSLASPSIKRKKNLAKNRVHSKEYTIRASINPEQPKVFEVNFSLRKIGRIFFPLKYRIEALAMPELLNFSFPEG